MVWLVEVWSVSPSIILVTWAVVVWGLKSVRL